MDGFDDALAVDYLSYGFLTAANNIWAWIAVITAAFSLWRIKTLSSQLVSRRQQRGSSQNTAPTSSLPPKATAAAKAAEADAVLNPGETVHLLPALVTTSSCSYESEVSPKGKFSVYYNEDDDLREWNEGGDGGVAVLSEKLGWWCDGWEKTVVVRMGDMGWYRSQDLKVLDGSVVRLWDGRRRRSDGLVLAADVGVTW